MIWKGRKKSGKETIDRRKFAWRWHGRGAIKEKESS